MNDNTPPLVDPTPDPTKTNGKLLTDGPHDIIPTKDEWDDQEQGTFWAYYALLEKNGIVPWNNFKGNWYDFESYLGECGVGSGKPVVPVTLPPERLIQKKGTVITFTPPKNDTFECEPDIKGCPIVDSAKPTVEMPHEMFLQWIHLTHAFDTEWIAYLKGRLRPEDSVWVIESMYFPKQKANGAHVDAEDEKIEDGVIGSVHSHVGMKAFFSTEDEKHFNHTIEIVVNREAEVECCVRKQLECGRFSRVKTKVMLTGCDEEVKHGVILNVMASAAKCGFPTKAIALAHAVITQTGPLVEDLRSKLTRQTDYSTYTGTDYNRSSAGSQRGYRHSNSCVCSDCCKYRSARIAAKSGENGSAPSWEERHYRGYYDMSD